MNAPQWNPKPLEALLGRSPRGIVFTDVDGTLLDFETYQCPPEIREAIARLREAGVPVVAVTSKPAAEVETIREMTGILPLAIAEGGAVLADLETGGRFLPGGEREPLVRFLEGLRSAGWPVRGISSMTAAELAERTGLPLESARFALQREASEPFLFDEDTDEGRRQAFVQLAEKAGYRVVRGGRLYHLLGPGVDKGVAIRMFLATVPGTQELPTAGIGDAWNDLPMLAVVDHPFLLGSRVPETDVPIPLTRIEQEGPAGFEEAVNRFLDRITRL